MTMGDLMRVGARGFNLERVINQRLGISAKDDKLPKRLTHVEQIPGDPRTKVPQAELKNSSTRQEAGTRTDTSRNRPCGTMVLTNSTT